MDDEEILKLYASIEDGKLIIERQDGLEMSFITHRTYDYDCVEVLELGDQGHAVKALQCLLNCHGQHLEEDGSFGPLTQKALMIFQDQQQLRQDGTCTTQVWEKLIGR